MTTTKYDALLKAVAAEDAAETPSSLGTDRIIEAVYELVDESPTVGKISDGYHTFDDVYRQRMLFNAGLFSMWFKHAPMLRPHRSKSHGNLADDVEFEGYFIVCATLPGLGQIRFHYELEHWDLFQIEETAVIAPWDGHGSAEYDRRFTAWLSR